VKEAADRIGKPPFPLLGIDSDNEGAQICATLRVRCRPYRKNDQAYVEQNN